jgi:Flp pilus assembly protein TadD
MMGYFGFVPAREAFPKAEIAAREALRLDPGLAAGHTSMAYINHRFHWNWEAAEAGFKRVIALDPQYSTARHWYAAFLESMGRDEEAVAESRKAQALDPLALVIGANLGSMLGAASRVDEAVAQCRQLLEMDRSFWPAHWTLAHAYGVAGRLGDADREFALAVELSGRTPYVLAHLAEYYAQSNRTSEAAAILAELEALGSRQYVSVYYRAMIEAALGRTDDAFRSLDQALAERSASLAFLKIRRRLEPLRDDPRFQRLVSSVGLPE